MLVRSFVLPYQLVVLDANLNAQVGTHPIVERWRLVMKRLLTLGAASIAVLLLIVMPVASQAPQAEKTFSGNAYES